MVMIAQTCLVPCHIVSSLTLCFECHLNPEHCKPLREPTLAYHLLHIANPGPTSCPSAVNHELAEKAVMKQAVEIQRSHLQPSEGDDDSPPRACAPGHGDGKRPSTTLPSLQVASLSAADTKRG
ncbi:hypothetical protein F5Y16DRAFT_372937 [Xylariaceae sp. FL0255]|nr:hypothetical protein F5Y16DRAFT_372937 [Xylariaceae sp. FL0255]